MSSKIFPNLYKRTSTGAIQQWSIAVTGRAITTTYGQVNGKLQTTKDLVKEGKNAGRKNATEAEEQAIKEAKSQWIKKKKSGYVESFTDAQDGKTDSVIEGGALPMLAKVFEEHISKVKYPVAVQPKLDGHRCIAVIDAKGDVTLWTRTRKRITSVPHIEEKLKYISKKMRLTTCILDGELYNHDLKNDFEKLTSAARKQEASEESKQIQYHVYDTMSAHGFKDRIGRMADIYLWGGDIVQLVDTDFAKTEEDMQKYFTYHKNKGYEGSMVRLLGIGYENKRSHQLLKVKTFEDAEFQVVDVEEGRGKLQGHAGAFVVKDMFNGKEFRVKMSGETEKLKEYFQNKKKYIGKSITVQFQGRTSDGIPRFPVGLRFWEKL